MPPINQQGSRAGLITGLVVFAILFVMSSIFAFQYYGKWKDADGSKLALQQRYKDYISENQLTGTAVTELQSARGEQPNQFGLSANDSVVDVAMKQRDTLIGLITGTPTNTSAVALNKANLAIKDAQQTLTNAKIPLTLPATGLANALASTASAAASNQQMVVKLTQEVATAQASEKAATAQVAAVNAKRDQDLKDAQAKAAADLATVNAALDANKGAVTSMQADQAAQAKAMTDLQTKDAADLAAANALLAKANSDLAALKTKLANRRPDVTNAIVRQADGKLIRVPSTEICYINLGTGDQVTAGLTFEVYDKAEGVPAIPAAANGDDQLPIGKASIEITHVGQTSSECRIVKITPGAVLSEGDVIENLVYDVHTKYKFFVYGNFDLASNGRPNAADAEVIKRLITQWGGTLTDKIDENTDFVVFGAEPVLPTFSKDEITAENQQKLANAQEALTKYQELSQQAKDLHIPIMNQNRFLYYVGFYDQAKR